MMIKKKIIIKGPKVQDVGYRPFLLNVADSELIPHFDAKNNKEIDKDGNEIVEVFIGGSNEQIDNFIEFIKDENNRPKKAEVRSIEVADEDYKRSIRTTESFSRWLSNNQLYKMVTIGTVMIKKQDMMLEKQDTMIEKIDETKKDIVGEIKDLRWDLKSYLDQRLVHIEDDIAQIKAKIKMKN